MDCFKDKVVLITGASSGIGAGTAVEFAKHGAKLILTARNQENLEETSVLCQEKGLPKDKILILPGDVTKDEDIIRILSEGTDKFGGLDVLVNNAGAGLNASFSESKVEDLDRMYNINVRSVFNVTKAALPYLEKSKGNIMNMSSIAGTRPFPRICAYSMCKAPICHFTQMLALELAPKGVRVNVVNPGVILTEIFTRPGSLCPDPKLFPKFLENNAAAHPMGRMAEVEEVAQTILFLASDAASFITGAQVPIDGGRQTICTVPAPLE